MMHTTALRRAAVIAALAVVATTVGAGAAQASHFRASGPDFSISGDDASWVVTSAWRSGSSSSFVGLGGTTDVRAIGSYGVAPGSGTSTGVTLEVTSAVFTDEPLYANTVETFEGTLSTLGDGLYEIYVDSCCRVSDIQNSAATGFSQWVRFSKTGSTYTVAPRLATPIVYAPLSLDGTTALVSYAASGAATWTAITDQASPNYGSSALPCSAFVGGALEIGAEHCTDGAVYTDIYLTGTYWAFKVVIADADGRQSVAETLFRVESVPEPYLDDHSRSNGGATTVFTAYAADTIVNSWTVTCTAVGDSSDVVSGTSATSPITVNGFTRANEYDCVVAATNGAGTGTSSAGNYFVIPPTISLDLQFEVGELYSGKTVLIEGDGLDSESAYSLTMFSEPIALHAGTTDTSGVFSRTVTVPAEACIAGDHELRLVGQASGAATTVSRYVEIDEGCLVVRISATPFALSELADTGSVPTAIVAGLGVSTLALGALLLIGAGFVRRASRSTV